MKNDPQHPSASNSFRPGGSHPDEEGVATWLGHLPRLDAPAHLRASVLSAAFDQAATPPQGRLLSHSRWLRPALAAAACALLAFGTWQAFGGPTSGGQPLDSDGDAQRSTHPVADAAAKSNKMLVITDPSLSGLHDLETFDHMGFAQGDLIAAWGH